MSHFEKTVMKKDYYYNQRSTNRHMDQEFTDKYCGN